MALDKDGNLDIDKTVDGIVDDLMPPPSDDPEPDPDPEPEPDPKPTPEGKVTPEPEPKGEPEPKKDAPLELKPGDEGYVAPLEPKVAPKSWSKEMAPEFAKLPPTIQDYVLKREEDYTNGISQYKQAADYGYAVNQVVSPYMAHIQARGVDVPTALKFLLNADYVLTNSTPDKKAEFFTKLLKDYGVDQTKLGLAPAAETPEVRELRERQAKTENFLTEFQQKQLESRRTEVAKAVDTFASNPKNVYFNELSDDIVKFINAGYTLEDAYEKAVWANPVTRAKEQARLDKEKELATKKAADEAALKAKKATKPNVKETPSARTAPTGLLGSMDETIRDTYRKIQERTN